MVLLSTVAVQLLVTGFGTKVYMKISPLKIKTGYNEEIILDTGYHAGQPLVVRS
ncbi:hypothetical protein [Kalamiella sp. sgz302252]|uniref:hypothetical protein n=1 Tax=Pantoea sp. sgz302252 TaxID=3341827 RepID=UPI0036D24810